MAGRRSADAAGGGQVGSLPSVWRSGDVAPRINRNKNVRKVTKTERIAGRESGREQRESGREEEENLRQVRHGKIL